MASVGQWMPIKIEKWTQMKNERGSNTDVYVRGWTVHAEVTKLSLQSFGRSYEQSQTKLTDGYKMKVKKSGLDVKALYKVVFKGKRFTVTSIDDADRFHLTLTVEAK